MKFLIIILAAAVLCAVVIYFFLSPQLRLGILDLLTRPSATSTGSHPTSSPSQPPLNQTPPGFIGPNGPPGVIGPPGPPPNY